MCDGEDGGHHAVSSCLALSNKAVTLRHNDAGTAILKSIHQGSSKAGRAHVAHQ
jgi:hypothetical protein